MKSTKILMIATAALVVVGIVATQAVTSRAAAVAPASPPAGSSFDLRLAQRKSEQKLQIDEKTSKHISQRCVNAQGVVRALKGKTATMVDGRNTAYRNIDAVLWVNIGQLKLANQGTFTLEQNRSDLYQKMLKFQTTAAEYQQTLDDILVIGCQADPAGFQSLVVTARAYYAQLITQKSDIYDYTVNTVKPTLESFIKPLLSLDAQGSN